MPKVVTVESKDVVITANFTETEITHLLCQSLLRQGVLQPGDRPDIALFTDGKSLGMGVVMTYQSENLPDTEEFDLDVGQGVLNIFL